jgi:uncharacterized protein involved in exopolysaccharide biosynthesis
MIEPTQLLSIARRWAGLLALGLIVGLLAGYLTSSLQTPIYKASTRLLISNELQGKSSDFAGLTDQQLVLTYIELLRTKQLRDTVSERMGIEINSDQLRVQQVTNTQIIEINVEGQDPEQMARFANALALTLIQETETMRTEQFSTVEDGLTRQIEEMKKQVVALQQEYKRTHEQTYDEVYQKQLSEVNTQISNIQGELSSLQTEIAALSSVLSVEGRALLADKQARVTQLQSSFRIYDEIRAALLIGGKPTQASDIENDSELQQMKSTINLYQNIYLDLLSKLETTRSSRSQQTPNAVQIQKAFTPERPVRPIPLVFTALGAIVGVILAGVIVIFLEMFKKDESLSEALREFETKEVMIKNG